MTMMPIHHSGRWRYEYPSPSKPCRSTASLRPFFVMTKLDPTTDDQHRAVEPKIADSPIASVDTMASTRPTYLSCMSARSNHQSRPRRPVEGFSGEALANRVARVQSRAVCVWQAQRQRRRRWTGKLHDGDMSNHRRVCKEEKRKVATARTEDCDRRAWRRTRRVKKEEGAAFWELKG